MAQRLDRNEEQMISWNELIGSSKRNTVLYARAIGIENINNNECLKLDYKGIFGYLPKALIDTYELKGIQSMVGKVFEFVVNYTDREAGIFGADRIKALEVLSNRFWSTAEVDKSYEAFVRGVDQYNVYLLVEGVPTKMHRKDFSYDFYKDMRDVVGLGDVIDVKLLDYEKPSVEAEAIDDINSINVITEDETEEVVQERKLKPGQILVSRKALEKDPWDYINQYQVGSTYLGVIQNINIDYGIFLKLEPFGLPVRSNFPPNTDLRLLQEGEEVNVRIRDIDIAKRQISTVIITPRQGALKRTRDHRLRQGLLYDRK
ncbi:30s ribosomal protein S1 (plasmid) [Alkalihalophilus pseudofirmus OF4]|uniref:30s ribosomal protein S1 n=1 Tax=Alkalihalophilus pseudofirmus (strain ATCC BAA-2126 / JCM 17055 / OF4) TaxID=398511 RepID=D3G1F8_ALKPO|nr:hypothetical protein [Alkalihalophilus pseudofirmus]ADC52184.1 30s ribosomal protein S1 [Alkalihalophilus pseudofirmus OF4]